VVFEIESKGSLQLNVSPNGKKKYKHLTTTKTRHFKFENTWEKGIQEAFVKRFSASEPVQQGGLAGLLTKGSLSNLPTHPSALTPLSLTDASQTASKRPDVPIIMKFLQILEKSAAGWRGETQISPPPRKRRARL